MEGAPPQPQASLHAEAQHVVFRHSPWAAQSWVLPFDHFFPFTFCSHFLRSLFAITFSITFFNHCVSIIFSFTFFNHNFSKTFVQSLLFNHFFSITFFRSLVSITFLDHFFVLCLCECVFVFVCGWFVFFKFFMFQEGENHFFESLFAESKK